MELAGLGGARREFDLRPLLREETVTGWDLDHPVEVRQDEPVLECFYPSRDDFIEVRGT